MVLNTLVCSVPIALVNKRNRAYIDVVVEFNDSDLSFDNYMDLKMDLEDLFQRPIDLVILNDIKLALKANILSTITYAEKDK